VAQLDGVLLVCGQRIARWLPPANSVRGSRSTAPELCSGASLPRVGGLSVPTSFRPQQAPHWDSVRNPPTRLPIVSRHAGFRGDAERADGTLAAEPERGPGPHAFTRFAFPSLLRSQPAWLRATQGPATTRRAVFHSLRRSGPRGFRGPGPLVATCFKTEDPQIAAWRMRDPQGASASVLRRFGESLRPLPLVEPPVLAVRGETPAVPGRVAEGENATEQRPAPRRFLIRPPTNSFDRKCEGASHLLAHE
jgi:hypothetical protein